MANYIGIGKTTIVMGVAQELKERGVREGGVSENGPRIGKYSVNLSGCRFAADRLNDALINSDYGG